MASVTSLGNQELAELDDEIVLVSLEVPTNLFHGWTSQVLGEFLQRLRQFLVLGEDRAQVAQR